MSQPLRSGNAVEVDRLLVTNTLGVFELNGGVLKTESTTNNNGRIFFVGNGTDEASILFVGNATVIIRFAGFTILTDPNFVPAGEQVPVGLGLHVTRLLDPAITYLPSGVTFRSWMPPRIGMVLTFASETVSITSTPPLAKTTTPATR